MFSYISGLLIIGIVVYMAVIYAGAGMALFSLAGLVLIVLSLPITYLRKVNLQESIEVPITLTEKGKSIKILLFSDWQHFSGETSEEATICELNNEVLRCSLNPFSALILILK